MIDFPKIFADLTKAANATFVAGVSAVQAHPVVAACTVVVNVGGLTFYYYKNKMNKEKEDDLKYSSGKSTGEPESTEVFFYDPQTKSVTDVPPSITSDNIRQRREVSKSASFTTEKSHAETLDEKSNLTISDGSKTGASADNRNIDDGKISPGNNVDSDMSGEEKVIQYLNNVSQTDSTASTSQSIENLDENCVNVLVNLVSSNQADVSFEDISISSDTDVRSGSSVSSVLSGESDFMTCKCNNPVNTRMIPCNHRYLCHDCAGRILRLYKRCKICRSKIERYCVELSSG